MQDNRVWYDWLKKRHISDSIIADFNIYWGTHETIGDCIVIPVVDEGGAMSFCKYRRDPLVDAKPKYVYDRGGKVTLYGYWHSKDAKEVLITEGEMDTLVALSANIPAMSSTGGAGSFQESWGELLADKDVTLCFDNDEAGGRGMVRTLSVIPHAKVLFLPDRAGIKDISDYVTQGGDLGELMRSAVHFESVQDVVDHRALRAAVWQSTFFHDAYIVEHTKPVYVRQTTANTDEVSRAKIYPIPQLLKFRNNATVCIFHNEKTPSLHYYSKTNSCYCFGGCSRAYDAIDIYRKLHNCSFKEAIAKLI